MAVPFVDEQQVKPRGQLTTRMPCNPLRRNNPTLEERIKVYQSKLTVLLVLYSDSADEDKYTVIKNLGKENETCERNIRSSSRNGWVKDFDIFKDKQTTKCKWQERRQADTPVAAKGSVTVVTSLKKGEKAKSESATIHYYDGTEEKIGRPTFVEEDWEKGIFSITYATHNLNILESLQKARHGLLDCQEKMKRNEKENSKNALIPESKRAFVTYYSPENRKEVKVDELSINSEKEESNGKYGIDPFITCTDTRSEEMLGAPIFVLDINIQVKRPLQTTRLRFLWRFCTNEHLLLLILAITAFVINIVCIASVVSSLDGITMKNATLEENTSILCISRATLTSLIADGKLHDRLGGICSNHHNKGEECCADSAKAVEKLLEMILNSGSPAKWIDLKSMDAKNFVYSKASAHKPYIRTVFAQAQSDKYLLEDKFPIFYDDRNCSLGMDPYRHNHVLLEHKRNVTVTKEGFEIIVPGWYYVYTSVLFKPDTGRPCNDYKYQTWGHWIKLTRPGQFQNEMVLSTYHTCGNNTIRNKDTSYTGREMYLEVGDKLHAEVSGYGLISYQAYSNFMGLYLIHSGH